MFMAEENAQKNRWQYGREEYWPQFKRTVTFVGLRFKTHKDFERACADAHNHGLYVNLPGGDSWNSLLVEQADADKLLSLGYRVEEFDPNKPYAPTKKEKLEAEKDAIELDISIRRSYDR